MENKKKGDKYLNIIMIILSIAVAITWGFFELFIRPEIDENINNKLESIENIYDSIPKREDILNIYNEY